ncbi:MAG: Asp-tRNA(Asn)/Glu-tRNA(Gln) amidotransferase subunit GatC [Candidatus Levyibacteriota bacterium]
MKIDVKKIAKLANLTLTPEEETKFEKQLSDILQYVEKLNKVDVKDVEPTSQITGLENVTRNDDFTDEMLSQEQALSGAKSTHNGMFKVKALLENS